jgi:hypothetical protein
MQVTPDETLDVSDLVAAARELIHNEGERCIISIWRVLEGLRHVLGDRFSVSPDVYTVLDLIETLWEDPHIDQVPDTGWIEFAWREEVLDPAPSRD